MKTIPIRQRRKGYIYKCLLDCQLSHSCTVQKGVHLLWSWFIPLSVRNVLHVLLLTSSLLPRTKWGHGLLCDHHVFSRPLWNFVWCHPFSYTMSIISALSLCQRSQWYGTSITSVQAFTSPTCIKNNGFPLSRSYILFSRGNKFSAPLQDCLSFSTSREQVQRRSSHCVLARSGETLLLISCFSSLLLWDWRSKGKSRET